MLACCYTNTTEELQIITLTNNHQGFERVIFPGMSIEFQAKPEDKLEVRDGLVFSIIADRVACFKLKID